MAWLIFGFAVGVGARIWSHRRHRRILALRGALGRSDEHNLSKYSFVDRLPWWRQVAMFGAMYFAPERTIAWLKANAESERANVTEESGKAGEWSTPDP